MGDLVGVLRTELVDPNTLIGALFWAVVIRVGEGRPEGVPVRSRVVSAWVCGVALCTIGCGSTQNQTIRLSSADTGHTVVAAVGDEIDVTLQTIGPGQYVDPSISSGAAVFLGESPVGPAVPAGPTQLFRFEAVAPGRADITIPHAGEAPSGPAVPAFSISVRVD